MTAPKDRLTKGFDDTDRALLSAFVKAVDEGKLSITFPAAGIATRMRFRAYRARNALKTRDPGSLTAWEHEANTKAQKVMVQLEGPTLHFTRMDLTNELGPLFAALGTTMGSEEQADLEGVAERLMREFGAAPPAEAPAPPSAPTALDPGLAKEYQPNPYYKRGEG